MDALGVDVLGLLVIGIGMLAAGIALYGIAGARTSRRLQKELGMRFFAAMTTAAHGNIWPGLPVDKDGRIAVEYTERRTPDGRTVFTAWAGYASENMTGLVVSVRIDLTCTDHEIGVSYGVGDSRNRTFPIMLVEDALRAVARSVKDYRRYPEAAAQFMRDHGGVS